MIFDKLLSLARMPEEESEIMENSCDMAVIKREDSVIDCDNSCDSDVIYCDDGCDDYCDFSDKSQNNTVISKKYLVFPRKLKKTDAVVLVIATGCITGTLANFPIRLQIALYAVLIASFVLFNPLAFFSGLMAIQSRVMVSCSIILWIPTLYIHLLRLFVLASIISAFSYVLIRRFNEIWIASGYSKLEREFTNCERLKENYRTKARESRLKLSDANSRIKSLERQQKDTQESEAFYRINYDDYKKRLQNFSSENETLRNANQELLEELLSVSSADQISDAVQIENNLIDSIEERAKELFLSGKSVRYVEELLHISHVKSQLFRARTYPDEYIWMPDGSFKSKKGRTSKVVQMQEIA